MVPYFHGIHMYHYVSMSCASHACYDPPNMAKHGKTTSSIQVSKMLSAKPRKCLGDDGQDFLETILGQIKPNIDTNDNPCSRLSTWIGDNMWNFTPAPQRLSLRVSNHAKQRGVTAQALCLITNRLRKHL